jgi:ribonuclease R
MLPEKLSNGLCSLNPDVDRAVLVCDMVVTPKGLVKAYQFYDAVMHSAARADLRRGLAHPVGPRPQAAVRRRAALVPQLQNLQDVFRVLLKAREARGARRPRHGGRPQIVCDAAGRIEKIVPRSRNDAHRLIEECMLAANTCAADFLKRSKHPGLYRVHEGPTPERLALLREFLRTVGLALGSAEEPTPGDYAELGRRHPRAARCAAAADHAAAFDAAGGLLRRTTRATSAWPTRPMRTSPRRSAATRT